VEGEGAIVNVSRVYCRDPVIGQISQSVSSAVPGDLSNQPSVHLPHSKLPSRNGLYKGVICRVEKIACVGVMIVAALLVGLRVGAIVAS